MNKNGTNVIIDSYLRERLNESAEAFLQDILSGAGSDIQHVTREQISVILSIQDRISQTQDGEWRIEEKKKRGGNLDLKKFRDKIFLNIEL